MSAPKSIAWMCYWFPALTIASLLLHLAHIWIDVDWVWTVIVGSVQAVFIILGLWTFFRASTIVDPDKVAVRQMFNRARTFTNCRMFNPWFAQTVLMPASQQIETTAKSQKGEKGEPVEHALFSLIEQNVEVDGKPVVRVDRQFFVLKVVYFLNVFDDPGRVIQVFFRAFRKAPNTDGMLKIVKDQVLDIAVARADELLQTKTMEKITKEVKLINADLEQALQEPLKKIGVTLVQVTIEDVQDVGEGYLTQITRSNRAAQRSTADRAIATANQEAVSVEAEQNRIATLNQLTARRTIAMERLETLRVETDARAQEERLGLQQLVQTLRAVKGKDGAILLKQFAGMTPTQISDILKELASKSGLQTGGGSIVTLGSLLDANGAVALAEALKRFLELKKP